MKFRKGFVSNSSSSSFVLAYDKSGILTDPRDIVDYIDNHPRARIFFMSDLCEGYDLFELNNKQKNYLLKHRQRFIKWNRDPVKALDWDAEVEEDETPPEIESPSVTAYTKVFDFYHYPFEYNTPEVDMSDMEEVCLTIEEAVKTTEVFVSPELTEKARKSEEYWQIKEKREREAIRKQKKDYLEKVKEGILEKEKLLENLEVKLIEVDNNSCDPDGSSDYEFAPRYFGLDEDTYYEKIGDPDLEEEDE